MDLGLKDKVVVITGGTAGIGEACALAFSREGAHVAVCGRTQKRIAAFKERCAQAGADVFVKQADAGQAEELQAFADAVVSRFGTIDVWINNAGINVGKRLMEITPEDWQQTVAVNLSGVLFGTQIAARAMGEKGGVILNASSFASLIPSVGGTMYGATKAAVSNMTKTMAAELAPQHIRVNAYIPGIIDTPMNAERIADDANHALINAIALHRVGTADEMAQALIFLASDQASYITGTAIEVSGGKYAVQNSEILWG
ncbi:SDR family NAD(P)-dependent oxidoreductase [uncultured Megasphaera sp.]|uniref:SDR family NAD(P)-dependent oxidoreductase n=1 Tax=uncultured Megasphaera sp. TaxID=165188 RepID=UPI0025981EB0|nr:SDR family oxidoreductase [uncultured Megasphaera sp.]